MKPSTASTQEPKLHWHEWEDRPEELMKHVFGKDGLLQQRMPGFEYRPEQQAMAQAVARACAEENKAIIEAGTGTGKSLAYLIPLILWSIDSGVRAVISTGTKTLQHQLLEKDIPAIRETLGLKFNASLCLGAENYMCARRYRSWIESRDSYSGSKIHRTKTTQWAKRTRTGIKAEANLPPEIWRQICRDSDLCPLALCNKEPDCHYNKARKQWQSSHLLIVNHYLFFSNIVSGGNILPEYGLVLFDEAHQVEEIASNYLGMEVSNFAVERFLNTLHHTRTGRGLYQTLSYIGPELCSEIKDRTAEMRSRAKALFDAILAKYSGWNERIRMREPIKGDPLTLEALKELNACLKRIRRGVNDAEDRNEVDAALMAGEDLYRRFDTILHQKRQDGIYWIEVDRSTGRLKPEAEEEMLVKEAAEKKRPSRVSINMVPVSIGEDMQRKVYSKVDSSIFVSATLSVAGDLEYSCERLGLERAKRLILPHSFDYENRVVLWVDREAPDPSRNQQHHEHVVSQLDRLLPIVPGGTFVLFTSYRMLDAVFFSLKKRWKNNPAMGKNDILLMRHGEAPREELLDRFREHGRAALFGTATFWQGIDVPGSALQCVAITKLPFAVPDDPIIEGRVEDLREKGRNPFYEYQVPQAVMMFRQGFGRLMRKRDDRGAIVVFDPRVFTKKYGALFIESVPECIAAGSVEDIDRFFRGWER